MVLSRTQPASSSAQDMPNTFLASGDTGRVSISACTSATHLLLSATTSGCLHSAITCQLVSSQPQPSRHCVESNASLSPRLAFTVMVASHPNSILLITVADAAVRSCVSLPTHLSGDSICTVVSSHSLFTVKYCLIAVTLSAAAITLLMSHTTNCPSQLTPHPCSSGATSCNLCCVGVKVSMALSAFASDQSLPLS